MKTIRLSYVYRIARISFRNSRWLQVAVLTLLWLAADRLTRWSGLPLPGSVMGLFVLWALLETKVLSPMWFRRGAKGLLDHLLLFFVPAMLALVDHPELLSWIGVKLLLAVLIGTPLVMIGTAVVVELGFRWNQNREGSGVLYASYVK